MEQQILNFLRQAPGVLFSAKEVSKRMDRERYREDASWARPFLRALFEKGIIRRDDSGAFYFPKEEL